jgi:serralysin
MADIIKLTDATTDQASFVVFNTPVARADGFRVEFDFYAYGGTGGDGVSFIVLDGASNPTSSGGFGGSLGYAQRDGQSGIQGGYLGIGFDKFGNFSNPTEGRVGGPGLVQDAIAVRGSQATEYKYLGGTSLAQLGATIDERTTNRDIAKRKAAVALDGAGNLTVQFDLNRNGTFEADELLITRNVINDGNGALPSSFRFGFAASTGNFTNVHEIGEFKATTFNGRALSGTLVSKLVGTDTGAGGKDNITGTNGNDSIIGGAGGDTIKGGGGADRFIYSGLTKTAALRQSTLNRRDKIADFNITEGDRIQLDFDNNLATVEKPKRMYNAGDLTRSTKSLKTASKLAFGDRNPRQRGKQVLGADQAALFTFRGRRYIAVNDGARSFSAGNDLMVDVTGIKGNVGRAGSTLAVDNFFA